MSNKYIFTVRNHIKSEPRISQIRYYININDFKLAVCYEKLIAAEKDEDTLKFLQLQLQKLIGSIERHEYFSDNSFYMKCLNKFVKTQDGWCNLKKL